MRAPFALLLFLFTAGCAREALPTMPEWSRVAPEAREPAWTARTGHAAPQTMAPPRPHRGFLGLSIPDGDSCLQTLTNAGAKFRLIEPKPGMRTPVSVVGSLGGVKYRSNGVASLVCDCRLAVVLDRLGPELRRLGVTEVRHMGAYAYRTTRAGRTSLHAFGLAIDVGGADVAGRRLSVAGDYQRGGASCEAGAPALNQLACELRRTGFFEEVITPDDDGDHQDHLHLAIVPL